MNPTVSIIVPAYNSEKYIEKCITSIINQTYSSIQLIVVNDGSTDDTDNIIKKSIKGYEWIQYICQNNQGVSEARNNGINVATGSYLLFVDGDDYIGREYVEQLVQCAQKTKAELVITGYVKLDETGRILGTIKPQKYEQKVDEAWAYRICAVCSRLYDKKYWDANQLTFIKEEGARGEDVPLALYANYTAKNIQILAEAEYYYVQHESSAMHQFQGLQTYHFPYQTVIQFAEKVQDLSEHNSIVFFQYGILKFFAQFWFDLGRGASKQTKKELLDYMRNFTREYLISYRENWKFIQSKNITVLQKILIQLLIWKIDRYKKV